MSSQAVTYATYLKLDELLNLQVPRSRASEEDEHDELLFIVIHQVYELWFKQLLHEMDYLKRCLRDCDDALASSTLNRILTILKTVVAQIDVLETLTPLQFNSFRQYLDSASGFQSAQFRELEFVLGMKRHVMLVHFAEGSAERERLQKRYDEPTIWDAFLQYLTNKGYAVPQAELERDLTQAIEPSHEVQQILIQVYREDHVIRWISELLLDMDEGLQEWRYRHVKMVERTIGTKQGTGGSAGAKYLQTTLHPTFPDLWAIRSEL